MLSAENKSGSSSIFKSVIMSQKAKEIVTKCKFVTISFWKKEIVTNGNEKEFSFYIRVLWIRNGSATTLERNL